MKLLDEVGQSGTPKVRAAWPIGFTPADLQRAPSGERTSNAAIISTGNVIGVVDDDPGEGTWDYRIRYPSGDSGEWGPWASILVAPPAAGGWFNGSDWSSDSPPDWRGPVTGRFCENVTLYAISKDLSDCSAPTTGAGTVFWGPRIGGKFNAYSPVGVDLPASPAGPLSVVLVFEEGVSDPFTVVKTDDEYWRGPDTLPSITSGTFIGIRLSGESTKGARE